MPDAAAEIAVDLIAKHDKLDRQLQTAGSRVDRSLGAMEQRGSAFASRFSGLLGGISAALLVAELGKLADTSKELDAQLRLATTGFGSFNKAQLDTRKIAADTRSSLEATTSLYGNFARASQQSGRSQEDAARATETFSKALKIGGADANAAASATLQFGQALASGALRGDEFNSIAEASPRIVRLIADSMGVTQGAVRALAAEGKLTSDVLFRALTDPKFTKSIDADFKQLPATFGEAMQAIENAAVITFGAFDQGGQFSNAIVNILSEGTTSFTGLEDLARNFGIETRAVFDGLGSLFDPIGANGNAIFDALGIKIYSVKEQIESLLGSFDRVGTAGANFANFLNAPGNFVRGFTGGQQVTVAPPMLRANFRVDRARSLEQAQARRVEGQLAERFPGVNRDGRLNLTGAREAPAVVRPTPAAGKKTKKTAAPKSPLNEDVFTRQEAQLNDRILRARGDEADTAEQRADIEVARIEAQRVKNDDLIKGDKRITDVQRLRLTALTDLAASTEKAAVIRERDVAIEQRASASIRRAAQSSEAGNRNEQDILRSKIDLAKTAGERKQKELDLLALAQQQERVDQEQLIADRRRVLVDKNATPEARATATADIADAQRRLGTLAQTQPNERAAVERRYASRGQQYAEGFNADRLKEDIQGIQIDGLESLNDGLADAITGAKSLGDVFHDVAGGIVRDLLRIAIQQAIIKPIANSLFGPGATGGSAGGGGGLLGSVVGSIGSIFNKSGSPSGLPGLASGGSIAAGGMGGVDKNVLSINGVPRAMISANERLSVVNPNLAIPSNARVSSPAPQVTNHYSISVDATNSVTPDGFARELSGVILAEAARMDGRTYKNAVRDTPGHIASYGQLKG